MPPTGSIMEKECKVHGLTKFNTCKDGDGTRLRCGLCQTEAVTKRRRNLKLEAIEYKGGMCADCGYSSNPSVLEFHHTDPSEKEFAIGSGGITRSFEKVKIELDKCLLLCANCHREEHDRIESGQYTISPVGNKRFDMFFFAAINS